MGAQGGGAGSEDEEGEAGSESEDEIAQWGSAKADYYNTDKITTQEQALAEEQEARRLQQKRLKSLREADFGFDEAEWATTGQDEENEEDAQQSEEAGGVVLEKLPQLQIRADMSDAEKLKLLRRRYPEFESFAKVMVELQPVWDDLKRDFDDYNKSKSSSQADSLPVSVTQFRALSAYLGALTMYFAILTSTARAAADGVTTLPMQPQELREHEIVEYIQQCQDVWEAVKNLDDSNVLPDEADEEASFDGFEGIGDTTLLDNVSSQRINGTSLPSDEQPKNIPGAAERIDPRTAASDARRAARRAQLAASFDMTSAELARAPNLNAQRRSVAVATHDLADEAPLDEREAAEKARRKKSLRFYTSRIAQKANKDSRMADGVGPDDDLPYKERFRDKVERLNREAEARGRKKDIDESDGDDFEDDREEPGMTNAERENDDEYNALIGRAQDKKVAKRQRDEAYRAAKEQGGRPVVQESIVPHTGRREIGWTIEKNKGLTPKRSKLLKNPRVKVSKHCARRFLGYADEIFLETEALRRQNEEAADIQTNLQRWPGQRWIWWRVDGHQDWLGERREAVNDGIDAKRPGGDLLDKLVCHTASFLLHFYEYTMSKQRGPRLVDKSRGTATATHHRRDRVYSTRRKKYRTDRCAKRS